MQLHTAVIGDEKLAAIPRCASDRDCVLALQLVDGDALRHERDDASTLTTGEREAKEKTNVNKRSDQNLDRPIPHPVHSLHETLNY